MARSHPFVWAMLRKHTPADLVADRPHALGARAQVIGDDHATAVELDAGSLRAQALGVRRAADGEEHLVCVHGSTFAASRESDLQPSANLGDLGHLAVGVDLATQAGQ